MLPVEVEVDACPVKPSGRLPGRPAGVRNDKYLRRKAWIRRPDAKHFGVARLWKVRDFPVEGVGQLGGVGFADGRHHIEPVAFAFHLPVFG